MNDRLFYSLVWNQFFDLKRLILVIMYRIKIKLIIAYYNLRALGSLIT